MFLTAYNLAEYLLTKGLIDRESVVDGDLAIAEAGRRNRNFKILRRRAPGLFLKQIKTTEAQAISTIEREAAFYRAVGDNPKYGALRNLIPRFIDYDPKRHALTLLLTDNAESIQERQLREGSCREDVARVLGKALATVHLQGAALLADPSTRQLFAYQVPWPLTFDATGQQALNSLGPIGPALTAGIRQSPMLVAGLNALRAEWRFDSLLHNDMKWDNCLLKLPGPGSETESPELTIVDWELADIGDGAWDVAGIFKEYIMAALISANAQEVARAQNIQAPSPVTLESLRPSLQAFWGAYARARVLQGYNAQTALLRTVRFTAARMIIGVLEYLGSSPQLGPLGTSMLRAASGLLEAPQVAVMQLFGSFTVAQAS